MYSVKRSSLADWPSGALQQEWCRLEAHSAASFFLSWHWIGTWLATLPEHLQPDIIQATTSSGQIVGLACFIPHSLRRAWFTVRCYSLHSTGDTQLDALMIEYNGLLVDIAHPAAQGAMLEFVLRAQPKWEELCLPALRAPLPASINRTQNRLLIQTRAAPTFQIGLAQVRASANDYVSLLHSNTRSQIRRGLRRLKDLGPIRLVAAQTLEQAESFFTELVQFHQQTWHQRSQPGAFANAYIWHFHRQLIRQAFASGAIQLLCVRVAERPIAYLYNFVYQKHIYNYQVGIHYSPEWDKYHPGLIAHTLAIEFNAGAGQLIYDFMYGDQRYKRQLSTQQTTLYWLHIQRPQVKFWIERRLRQGRQVWRRYRQPAKAPKAPIQG